jgi:hypothetical protein
MNSWTALHIGAIYYTGLFLSLVISSLILVYLRPIKSTLAKMAGYFGPLCSSSFKISVILSGLLAALSVNFKGCSGGYSHLLNAPWETIKKGIEQLSACMAFLALILGFWVIFFLLLVLFVGNNPSSGNLKN